MTPYYRIPELSAIQVLSSFEERNGQLHLNLDRDTSQRELFLRYSRQADCPIFRQALLAMVEPPPKAYEETLMMAFVYMDFSGIFDRQPVGKIAELQAQAERFFSPKDFYIDFGMGPMQYLAFERSASMSRNCKISFVRADLYEPLRKRMMLDMEIGLCQLSKLFAYNGLMFSSGQCVNTGDYLWDHKIILVDNPKNLIKNVKTITVKDDGTDRPVRKYSRVEEVTDIEITAFDGEGLITPTFSRSLDPLGHKEHPHHSFQIRLPYIKGVVHKVDFKALFIELGVTEIRDLFGELHPVSEVEMILTKSMFKGYGWMMENNLSWAEYLSRCRKYEHRLYVSGMDSIGPCATTELNYQFLTTANITEEEFRPKDLPHGWSDSLPKKNHWLTKATEEAYWSYIGDPEAQQAYYKRIAESPDLIFSDKRKQRALLVEKNPLFLQEPYFVKELRDKGVAVLRKYENANLFVAGDVRYLSDDLIRLLAEIAKPTSPEAYTKLTPEFLSGANFYAPQPAYTPNDTYLLLRNPHIARNEEVIATALKKLGPIRKKYLSHLHYVLMVDSRSLIPERLGGADFDGDLVKTISDPILNQCVARNYGGSFDNASNLPLLKIPAADPILQDAQDWKARLEIIKSTFSSRVGQISNAALRRSVIAYNENVQSEEKERCREETELLAILTGLEIDSAKSGIKPDLSAYLGTSHADRSLFLRFRNITKSKDEKLWYKPTIGEKLSTFFASTDWDAIHSNLEKLPYYAKMLREHTVPPKPMPARDEELFIFATDPKWKEKLDPKGMARMESVIADFEEAHRRCYILQNKPLQTPRRTDIQRILFARNQENLYTPEDLYNSFNYTSPKDIHAMRQTLEECQWQFTPPEYRCRVLDSLKLPYALYKHYPLLCDFRAGGYRVLGDVLCDLDDMYQSVEKRKKLLCKNGDSEDLQYMLKQACKSKDYQKALVDACLFVLFPPYRHEGIDSDQAVMCAIALGKRRFAIEVLPWHLGLYVIDCTPKWKRKLRRWFRHAE